MRILIALILACCVTSALAEDLIVFCNGNVVKAIVLEIQKTDVKYKLVSNPQGPTYTVDKAELLSIIYENGEKDVFRETHSDTTSGPQQSSSTQNVNPQKQISIPAPDNAQRISRINNSTVRHGNRKPDNKKLKTTKSHTWIMGITDGSILSDDNISVDFQHTYDCQYIEKGKTKNLDNYTPSLYCGYYKILITNKTTHPVYIDIANSFRIWPEGKSESFYNNVSITNTTGNQNGATLGLGAVANTLGVGGVLGQLSQGLGIGSGSNNATAVTTIENSIIAIPPGGQVSMPRRMRIVEGSVWLYYEQLNPTSVQPDIYQQVAIDKKDRFEKNRYIALPNGEENKGMRYYITYSATPDFSIYYSIPFGFYIRGLFGNENDYDEFTADDGQVIIGNKYSK